MKTESKKQEKCLVELNVSLDAEEMKAIVKDVEKAFMRQARLPGFRPGKVPIELIRKNFAEGLKQEIERAMFQKNIAEAVKAESLDEVGIADVKNMKHGAEGGGFTAVVEVKPTFKLPAYKGVKIGKEATKVEDKAVEDQLARLRAAYAKYEDAQAGEAVAAGDFVQIDYSGTVDGKPIAEIAPAAKIVAGGTGFWTQVEEGRFLPEILDAVTGMKAGETKEGVKAKFDKDSAPEGLKGAKAVYTVTLKAFRRRVLPTDAEFVEKAKAESLEKLAATIREQMEREAARQDAARRENEAVEALLKKADFDVPPSQVRRAMDGYLQQFAERAQYAGLTQEYFEKNRDKILKDAEEVAVRQVRLWYIVEAIAKEEKIAAGEGEDADLGKKVLEFILANAK